MLIDQTNETAIANLSTLHTTRLGFLEKHLESQSAGPFLMGEDCSYADIFLFTCVRTVESTPGFEMLRAVVGESPFADFPITAKIAASVGDIDVVRASVGNRFSECPI